MTVYTKNQTDPASHFTASEVKKVATGIGAKAVAGAKYKGRQIYRRGNDYLSYDIDGHRGGFWKVSSSLKNAKKGKRSGTWNWDLTKRVGK